MWDGDSSFLSLVLQGQQLVFKEPSFGFHVCDRYLCLEINIDLISRVSSESFFQASVFFSV